MNFSITSFLKWQLCLISIFPLWAASATVDLQRTGNQVAVIVDGKPFTTYYFLSDIAKPYLMPLRTASGLIVTRSFPVKNDASAGNPKESAFEPHQRPLYFGHGNVDGLDFWAEQAFDRYYNDHDKQAYGHATLKTIHLSGTGTNAAKIEALFSLRDPSEREIGEETERFTFSGNDKVRIVDCEFVLHAADGPLVLGDTKEGTFGIRLAPELSGPAVQMTNSNGARGEKEIWGKRANWVNYAGFISGKPVSVAIFDHPRSFRHPTTWHAREYGLFAANPFGLRYFTHDENQDGSWTIREDKTLLFRYRVLIQDGPYSSEKLSEAYDRYSQIP